MTPVFQSKLFAKDAIHNGNCFAACLASILDLPLWMIPPFEDMFGHRDGVWFARVEEWLERMLHLQMVRTDGHQPAVLPEFYIASGISPRGVQHSVIYRQFDLSTRTAAVIAHDPHPSGAGIASVEWTWHLEPLVTVD